MASPSSPQKAQKNTRFRTPMHVARNGLENRRKGIIMTYESRHLVPTCGQGSPEVGQDSWHTNRGIEYRLVACDSRHSTDLCIQIIALSTNSYRSGYRLSTVEGTEEAKT
eukprot:904520-Amorphochlora_amoeboformis.AAC.1